jgi:hypothetical protein
MLSRAVKLHAVACCVLLRVACCCVLHAIYWSQVHKLRYLVIDEADRILQRGAARSKQPNNQTMNNNQIINNKQTINNNQTTKQPNHK